MNTSKTSYKYIILCCSHFFYTFFLLSCSKNWLEAKPELTTVVPASLDDCQQLLNNSSNNTIYPNLGELASDGHLASDAVWSNSPASAERDACIWSKSERHTLVLSWNNSYKRIATFNVVLETLDNWIKKGNSPNAQYNDIKGQALFFRALNFFCLSQLYAPQYQKNTAGNLPGIVLRLDTDLTKPSARSSLKETFEIIIKDLRTAAGLLAPTATFPIRSSRWAAFALLARVYLVMGEYDEALTASNECLKIRSALIDFNTVPPLNQTLGYQNVENIFFYSTSSTFLSVNPSFDSDLLDSYRTGDLRKTVYFRTVRGRIGFMGNYDNVRNTTYMGLATDEIYLIRAECYARQNKTNDALADLNTLLQSRWDSTMIYEPLTAENAEEALITILEERKKELILRGTRWSDLRRLNLDPRFTVTLTRTLDGNIYTLAPNSPHYVFPIPDDVLDMTNLTQTPGYGK